jgi:hypothetical protein
MSERRRGRAWSTAVLVVAAAALVTASVWVSSGGAGGSVASRGKPNRSTTTTTVPPPPMPEGFDTCSAPSTTTMATWKASSPYTSAGIYIGGANAACVNVTSGWITTVEGQGWKLAPLYVGLQAPGPNYCSNFVNSFSLDPGWAAVQGLAAGDDAATKGLALGLPWLTPIYFDLEGYNSTLLGCTTAVRNFVNGWVYQLHVKGYRAGLYSSSASGIKDEAATYGNPSWYQIDGIWFANWDGRISVFGDPFFSDTVWPNHQRLHQFRGGHDETWGGITVNVDTSAVDGILVPHE